VAVAFEPGQDIVRGDLDIFLTNGAGSPTNAAEISYAIYFLDESGGPPGVEVLIGSATRTPTNPAVGEYFAALMVPPTASVGTYRIRWTFRETVGAPQQQVVMEFAVVTSGTTTATTFSSIEQGLIDKLRILIRDNCVGAEETVELDVGGELMVVRMDDLWETLHNVRRSTS
jgi:hypothetical protein